MPERPDLEYVVSVLRSQVVGATVEGMRVQKPLVLRNAVGGDAAAHCAGLQIASVTRRSHFVLLELRRADRGAGGVDVVISPMLVGVLELVPRDQRERADEAVAWSLSGGTELRYRDNKQMGKVYLIAPGERHRVPRLEEIGIDVLDGSFTREAFRELARGRRDQVRVMLMDKTALDALGNAYADEVLWAAQIHPKAWVRDLTNEQLDRLHDAIVEVIGGAVQTIARRAPPLSTKLRDFLSVRGKAGAPCPRCGTKVRRAGVRGYDAHFCPRCQPDDRGSGIVDWRKV